MRKTESHILVVALVSSLVLFIALAAKAQTPPAGDIAEKSFVFDGHAFSVRDDAVSVVNAQNPSILQGKITVGMIIRGYSGRSNVLYLARDTAGVTLVNYTNPAAMQVIRTLPLTAGYAAQNVKVFGNRAYVLEAKYGSLCDWKLRIYNATNAANPALLAVAPLMQTSMIDPGQITYIDTSHIVLILGEVAVIYNVAKPDSVFEESEITRNHPIDLMKAADYVFIPRCQPGCGASAVDAWGISNLKAPVLISTKNIPRRPYYRIASITTHNGKTILLLGMTDGQAFESVSVMDVTNPAAMKLPKEVRLADPSGGNTSLVPLDIDVLGNIALVSCFLPPHPPNPTDYFMARIDISNPDAPKLLNVIAVP